MSQTKQTAPYQDEQHCHCTQEYRHGGWVGRERLSQQHERKPCRWIEIRHTQMRCAPTGATRVTKPATPLFARSAP